MTSYEEAVRQILSIPGFAVKNPPEHTQEFLKRLGNPQEQVKIIHVAGTNGKGSVCQYIQGMMLSLQIKVGLFTSPHLVKINERIQMNGIPVDDEAFLESYNHIKVIVRDMEAEGFCYPSYFEFLFGMAMWHFAKEKAEYVILETGLGGKLDATNAVRHPALCIITSISMDHMDVLGDTIEQIAANKAGIIKQGVPVICDGTNGKATEILRQEAEKMQAPCKIITKSAMKILEKTSQYLAFQMENRYSRVQIAGIGQYQIVNAMIAIEAVMQMKHPNDKQQRVMLDALAKMHITGRMEELSPGVLIDGAHNEAGVRAFAESISQGEISQKRVLLFSALGDKDYKKMIQILSSQVRFDTIITTTVDNKRGMPAKELGDLFQRGTDVPVISIADVKEALDVALEEKGEAGQLYILGSLYLIGTIIARVCEATPSHLQED